MSTVDLSALMDTPAHDHISLKAELDNIQREQAADAGEPKAGQSPESYSTEVQVRCRRAIEIIAILRRTNTGPAKVTGKRGAAKKGKIDMSKLRSELLD